MIKLQEFAKQQGVTDRQIQRLLKKYESELKGLFERQGTNGTWLSEEACSLLRSKMKSQPIDIYDDAKDREIERLNRRIAELEERVEAKDKRIDKLEDRVDQKEDELLIAQNALKMIEDKSRERIEAAVKEAEEVLKHRLQEDFNKQIAEERTRKLKLGEALQRVFGKMEI